jgi:hypothetical protein
MNLAMLDTFEKARIFNPTDPELLVFKLFILSNLLERIIH